MTNHYPKTAHFGIPIRHYVVFMLVYFPHFLFAQKDVSLNLVDLQNKGKLDPINRDVSIGKEGIKRFVKIEKQLRAGQIPGKDERGIVWLPVDEFSQGTIAVQYVYAPKYDWQKLRTEQNGTYEKGIANPPAAHDWFTLTVHVEGETVKAFINHEPTPTLVVKKLNQTTKGRIGLTGINYDIESIRIQYTNP